MTHCQRVLALLSDHRPHTHHELYALGCIAHSRVADLRKKGYQIACWQAKDQGQRVSVYQLVGTPLNESRTAGHNGDPRPGTDTDLSPENVQPGRLDSLRGSRMNLYQPAGATVDETLAMVREEHERRYQRFLERVGLGENDVRGPAGRTEHAAFSPGLTRLRPSLGVGRESPLPRPTPGAQLELEAGAGCHSLPGERNQPQAGEV